MIAFAFYLLKVIICSGILFLYYHLALRNKLFHQWNRFYLLAAVIISLVVPAAEITIAHLNAEEAPKTIQLLQVLQSADGYLEEVGLRDTGHPRAGIIGSTIADDGPDRRHHARPRSRGVR